MSTTFHPSRNTGIVFHIVLILVFLSVSIWGLSNATNLTLSASFLLYLGGFLLSALPLPILVYRLYALLRGSYTLTSDVLHLRWGLRSESVPLANILWVRRISELEKKPPRPFLTWPGALVGQRSINRKQTIEYMAAGTRELLVIATAAKHYAISPENPQDFIHSFHRYNEQGTLASVRGQSTYPGALLGNVWQDGAARFMILSGLLLSIAVLAWVSLVISPPAGGTYPLTIDGELIRTITSAQLFLLPILNFVIYLLDLGIGLFFYRREETLVLAYLLWSTSLTTSIFFVIAVTMLIN
jgi:hypothetical protein